MGGGLAGALVFVVLVLLVVIMVIRSIVAGNRYMKNQKETGEDKRRVQRVISEVMQDKLMDYTLAVGNYTKAERCGRTTTYYYYSYILACNAAELIIYPFVVKDGQVLLRNCMKVNWPDVKFRYKITKKRLELTFVMMGEKLAIDVPRVQNSSGIENSAEPLGIYQETEVEKLAAYLPGYKERAKK